MSSPEARIGLDGATIVLGVTGGIAAYKAADLASTLVQRGAMVHVVMTEGATAFVQPLTFQALTRRPVYTSVFNGWEGTSAGHVSLARDADTVLIAPATANTIARLSQGIVDDMLGAVALATEAPVIVAPAMEHHMWHHPATQRNVQTLASWGVTVVEPDSGYLASGARGDGRLASAERLLAALRAALGRGGPLAGRRIVVTAGGTREAIDPVRYVGNRSSGRMGVAIAEAAVDLGASVLLVAGPTVDWLPEGVKVNRVESALDMEAAVQEGVADFRPGQQATQKLKKQPGQQSMALELVRNPDIIAGIDGTNLVKVGFAAETEHLVEHAQAKLASKGLAMIVANDAVRTIGSDRVQATLLFDDGRRAVELPETSKAELARRIVAEVVRLIEARRRHD